MRSRHSFRRLLSDQRRGTTAIEYALIIALVVLATTAAAVNIGRQLSFVTNNIARTLVHLPAVPYYMP